MGTNDQKVVLTHAERFGNNENIPPRALVSDYNFLTEASQPLANEKSLSELEHMPLDDIHKDSKKAINTSFESFKAKEARTKDELYALSTSRRSRGELPIEMGSRKRSRSFISQTSDKEDKSSNGVKYDAGSSLLMSSYGENASVCEINDSRFNDISCIDYADRTVDEKDTSRIDVSKVNISRSSKDSGATYTSKQSVNTSSELSDFSGSNNKRKFKKSFDCSSSNKSSSSAKRLKRDNQRSATDGIKTTNPSPFAIPLPSEIVLPPDRLKGDVLECSAAAPAEQTQKENSETRLGRLLSLAKSCASRLEAKCVSEQFSKSYNQESLRFTCRNGHNFFLSVQKLETAYDILSKNPQSELSNEVLDSLPWCTKCSKFYGKVKAMSHRLQLEVLQGLYEKRILLRCKKSSHEFSISYSKKFEQIHCTHCRNEEKDLLKRRLKREEQLRSEILRREQEKIFADARQQMDNELRYSSCSSLPCCCCLNCNNRNLNQSNNFLANLEQQINLRASALAKEFLAGKSFDEKLSYEKVYLVLKLNETPDRVLLEGMKLMGDSDQTRSYYKKLAKFVHPDKNGHPLAKSVFQKLANATQTAQEFFASLKKTSFDHFIHDERKRNSANLFSNNYHTF